MGKYVVIWFVKYNCIRLFSVVGMIIQKNSFCVLYMLLHYDMVQFLGLLFLCKLYSLLFLWQ